MVEDFDTEPPNNSITDGPMCYVKYMVSSA